MSTFARALERIGRAVHAIVHPQYPHEQRTLHGIAESINAVAARQREHAERTQRTIAALSERVEGLAREEGLRALDRQIERSRSAAAMHTQSLEKLLSIAQRGDTLHADERRLAHRLRRIAETNRPVLVGPWTGEVGFELLYWIPFVTWVIEQAEVTPDRIVVVSRGGPASWYAHLGGRYFDVLAQVTTEEFRARTEGNKKQRLMSDFDREIVRKSIDLAQLDRPLLLYPGLMYRLFRPYWKQETTVRRVEAHTIYRRLRGGAVADLQGQLPSEYIAVRFYSSSCFPDTPDNRRFIETAIEMLAASTDVVLLNTPFRLDDHRDSQPLRSPRVHRIDHLLAPDRNLDVQTAVIAGARAFVGTYGGYSYLAPLCGVPSVAFYSEQDAFFAHHLELAARVFRRIGAGSLVPLDVRDAELIRMVLGSPASGLVPSDPAPPVKARM